jgi:UDP-glucose 4-epimerase
MGAELSEQKYFVTGGAGFIGATTVRALLARPDTQAVTAYDNFSSGREWHLQEALKDPRFKLVRAELHDLPRLLEAMAGHGTVFHFASNPDISKAATDPDIDFRQGTELTRNVAEAVRITGVSRVVYTSGSGVYGDLGETLCAETHGPLVPVSTYAASKLAGEALLCSYSFMFGFKTRVFRFANVVGSSQTHGVGYDFVLRLLADPSRLRILGDGLQSKSYIHVDDVVAAMLLSLEKAEGPYQVYNVGTGDYITVNEIAALAAEVAGLDPVKVALERSGGRGGWKGDVPVMRLDSSKIEALGWKRSRGCRQALKDSMAGMLAYARQGLLK